VSEYAERKVEFVERTPQERCLFIAHWRRDLLATRFNHTADEAERDGFLRIAAAERALAAEYLAVGEAAVAAAEDPISAAAFVAEFHATLHDPNPLLDTLALARRLDYGEDTEDTDGFDNIDGEAAERLAAKIKTALNGPCETLTLEEFARRL
jgi:hypothetical protein